MEKISAKIKEGKILVSDGAWGTLLQQMGLKPGECPENWNLQYPERVLKVAQSYIDAGSDMIETNSFGGNAFKLSLFGLDDKVHEINEAAARISRQAAGDDKHVLGSIGPTGKILMMGDVTGEQLYDAFKDQAKALEAGGANTLVVETMTDIEEARAAVQACNDNTSCEIISTMTFDKSPDGSFYTMMGVSPGDMVSAMVDAGAGIIGANCGNGMGNMIGVAREIRMANADIPMLIHANAGAPVYKDGETVFLETPEQMAGLVDLLISAGANIIGGCCGTTPDHIKQIAEIVAKYNAK
ncbi:MAG: homocysteine S-methyltransferase family protein [Prolixibacteraceae bacterium]|jgi:5-methyltetrahydrofolate--homocysteine methyltransferase|nr:homocysteine S-methyltransferase family protein [Prolixibacteraceae bacterium]